MFNFRSNSVLKPLSLACTLALGTAFGTAQAAGVAKNVIFFLGDGMGPTTVTATRIYAVGEDGKLSMETLPYAARIATFSADAQTTDSAPSMAAYMTGVKMRNEVVSMTPDTVAVPTDTVSNNCGDNNGQAVSTLLELAKAKGKAVGAVTTTRVTHATPAATFAHICHRDLENDIAAQLIPTPTSAASSVAASSRYNSALGDGLEVMFGGGRGQFISKAAGGKRTDGRDLTAEWQAQGHRYVSDTNGLNNLASGTGKVLGLFHKSHMSFDLDRDPAKEPSLAEMTTAAIDVLAKDNDGYFLMVEGGRIDHALHGTQAQYALGDAVAFDNAIKAALAKVDLKNTLIVVTADHDHVLTINGYGKRTGKTTAANPGILGVVKNVSTGAQELDAEGANYTNLVFGNGQNRLAATRAGVFLDETITAQKSYHQETGVRLSSETHGGGDVMLMAGGVGAETFKGTIDNTNVFGLIKAAFLP